MRFVAYDEPGDAPNTVVDGAAALTPRMTLQGATESDIAPEFLPASSWSPISTPRRPPGTLTTRKPGTRSSVGDLEDRLDAREHRL